MPRCTYGTCTRASLMKPDENGDPKTSKYCERHTCIGSAGENPCFEKVVKLGDNLLNRCSFHYICTAVFCEKPRMIAQNSGWYECCQHHKCGRTDCYNIQHYLNKKEGYLKLCIKHKCGKPDCEAEKVGSTRQCAAHTCAEEYCSSMVEGDEKLCILHLRCLTTSCTKKRVKKGTTYQKFCATHIICELPECTKEKRKNSPHCINHTCFTRDCERPSGASFYCSEHTCKVTGCPNVTLYYLDNNTPDRSRYCTIHECRKDGCHRSSRNNTFGFCAEHNCIKPDCNNLKLIDPGASTPLTLCLKHYDESRHPPPSTAAPAPAPAPASPPPPPPPSQPDLTATLAALEALRRDQRQKFEDQRERLEDLYRLVERRATFR